MFKCKSENRKLHGTYNDKDPLANIELPSKTLWMVLMFVICTLGFICLFAGFILCIFGTMCLVQKSGIDMKTGAVVMFALGLIFLLLADICYNGFVYSRNQMYIGSLDTSDIIGKFIVEDARYLANHMKIQLKPTQVFVLRNGLCLRDDEDESNYVLIPLINLKLINDGNGIVEIIFKDKSQLKLVFTNGFAQSVFVDNIKQVLTSVYHKKNVNKYCMSEDDEEDEDNGK